ncbi:hypothetical protein C7S18_14725 [Ahniella affigens]|uniref:protein O-GlcNAc transferase n=1 Tax=Ahniella affigens TaxID=2021234 RepID=A0A2P1PU42_9GAMM|nr:hypothetical protein [Ahniella affigens]AVP98363.1 hypothetical protein C7S18_14725 [Ahniella affigens]
MNSASAGLRPWLTALAANEWQRAEQAIAGLGNSDAVSRAAQLTAATEALATQALIQKGQQAAQAGALASAALLFEVLTMRFPNEFEAWLNLARVRAQSADWASAQEAADRALVCRADRPEIWGLLLWLATRSGATRDAQMQLAARWCNAMPQCVSAWLAAARLYLEAGDYEPVHDAVNQALTIAPDSVPALWLSMLTPDRRNMRDAVDQQRFLARWRARLQQLLALPVESAERAAENLEVLTSQPNFYLAYLGEAFRDDLAQFGVLLQRLARPALGALQTSRRHISRSRRRIGIVTRYFRQHSISKLFLPLFLGLDPRRFEVIGICPNTYRDEWVERARQGLSAYHDGDGDLAHWAKRIAALDCDVLIYPDLGMNAITHALAALRLAPVQAMMWGHPISSGLSTVDWYLSSALMEPADGSTHYVERLYGLPGLGCAFEMPSFGSSQAQLPRRPGRVIALCAQMWAKLGPEHDAVFARLLAKAPNLDLHLTPAATGDGFELLRARLESACVHYGVDFAERIVIHPRLSPADFHALQGQADFLLDALGWSGGVTAFEGFAQDRPIVSLPGKLMRARHTAAMLQLLELPELLAADVDDYIEIATRVATDASYRAALTTRVRERKHRLFAHHDTHSAFADWLDTVSVDD